MNGTLLVETHVCMRELQSRYSNPQSLVDEHRAIVDALRSGDREKLLSQIDAHMDDAVERLTGKASGAPSTGAKRRSRSSAEERSDGHRAAGTRRRVPR